MWVFLSWLWFLLGLVSPIMAQESEVTLGLNRNGDNFEVEVSSELPDLVIEDSGIQIETENKIVCQTRVDYNSNGVANSLDYLECLWGKIFPFWKLGPKTTVFYPKKEYKNNYVLILYPKETKASRDKVEDGGQFKEAPSEGIYLAMDIYFDTEFNNGRRNTKIILVGEDEEAEIKKAEMLSGNYLVELIYQNKGVYYSILKELSWP